MEMKKTMERIIETRPRTAQRAHTVEAFINEEASHNDLNMNDMYVDNLERLKKGLKNAQYFGDVCYLVDETSRLIENLAEQQSEEKGGE